MPSLRRKPSSRTSRGSALGLGALALAVLTVATGATSALALPDRVRPATHDGTHGGTHGAGGTATGATTMAAPSPGRWVPVDRAAWRAQVAAFRALPPRPFPADAKRNAEFNATCTYSHSRADDAIVFPGRPGASHRHTFWGSRGADAFTTTARLLRSGRTSCTSGAGSPDRSAYWVPSLYAGDREVRPSTVTVYYSSFLEDKTATLPMPNGLRMIVGDPKLQVPTPRGAPGRQFYCAGGPVEGVTRSRDGSWPVCAQGGLLHYTMRFPDCWDGKHLDSPDHRSHVGWAHLGRCTAEFPVAIPSVSFVITYPTRGSRAGFRLSSGMGSSMHGDAFVAWDPAVMNDRVRSCLTRTVTCDSAGDF
ncbi:MAG: DUF1996 domain-containing protein [Actinobacteria bacterium]|nr:DUF1996 domain-containing protein [Actinomycetota bacterium]